MKTFQLTLLAFLLIMGRVSAQEVATLRRGFPVTISLFSESISLPTFNRLQTGGMGLQLGTEWYYCNRPGSQFFQTLNMGFYRHPNVQSGLFINSQFGYRKGFGPATIDAFIGAGALAVHPVAPSYAWDANDQAYQKAAAVQLRLMPTVGGALGYRIRPQAALFVRYELFGEMPFSEGVLPHQALHLGIRLGL